MNKYFLPVAATTVAGIVLLGACGGGKGEPSADISGPVVGKHIERCDMDPMAYVGKPGPRPAAPKMPKAPAPAPKPVMTKAPATKAPSAPAKSGSSGSTGGKGVKPCKTEHELEIRTSDGIFEEDVTVEVYELCTEGEKYPACREGK